MTTPHKHAELIKKWADGAVIEYKDPYGKWLSVTMGAPTWGVTTEYRVKPEPESSMTGAEAFSLYAKVFNSPERGADWKAFAEKAMKGVVDEAVRRYARETANKS